MEFDEQADNEPLGHVGELYNVELDIYRGPLDLLLYLIRQTEVDICDIPIAEITGQYLAYIDLMREVNITIAGEFVLMAATLMEIKSKMILPREELGALEGEDAEDPRTELVRQLIQYKRFKDAARALEDADEEQSKKFPRPPLDKEALGINEPRQDEDIFGDVGLWDLLTAFSKVLRETTLDQPHTILDTDKPLRYFMAIVLDSLREQGKVRFTELFVDTKDRGQVIGVFLAILELIRLRRAKVQQPQQFGEIYISLGDENPDEELPDNLEFGYATGGPDAGDSSVEQHEPILTSRIDDDDEDDEDDEGEDETKA
ncbi:MAG: segregation/condensation protein A [Planctomycetes bacterium]|nr:segregation/condensation protein A [Planctomycetota bacterium]